MKRTVFFLSDHTGITVEAMGRALLSQFGDLEFDTVHWPFLDSVEKAERAARLINQTATESPSRPLVFSTLVDPALRSRIRQANAMMFDFFDTYTQPLETELEMPSCPVSGQYHGIGNEQNYTHRIQAVNYALANDDGATTRNYPAADLVLLGVSRSGKTPTCLYLALQYGILAANYPLTEEDLETYDLPSPLKPHRRKLFGLTISAEQLQRIRKERRTHGRYASLEQCALEIKHAQTIYRNHGVPFLDTTSLSIEEIAAKLLQHAKLESRIS